MQWWDEAELTMSKLISTPPHPVVGAKISPHPYPPPVAGLGIVFRVVTKKFKLYKI